MCSSSACLVVSRRLPQTLTVDEHGEMKADALKVAVEACEMHAKEKDVSKCIKVRSGARSSSNPFFRALVSAASDGRSHGRERAVALWGVLRGRGD